MWSKAENGDVEEEMPTMTLLDFYDEKKTGQKTHYYNTNGDDEEEYNIDNVLAEKQEDKILAFFRLCPDSEFTPFEIRRCMNWHEVPITSVRRAMTNLTKHGYLEKTHNRVREQYGKANFTWRLKRE